jgi:hypothetical protein
VSSCSEKQEQLPKIFFLEDSVCILGEPDSTVLTKFIKEDHDKTFLFNNMVSMTLILEAPAIYHCFILEQVGTDKQIYYLKMDDAIKYNWIPPYDSIDYDLSLDFTKTENAGKYLSNKYTGEFEHIKPDIPMKWSSKYEQIPVMRKKSEEYSKIVSLCDDIEEFSHYYNHSLFFQNKSFVSEDDKVELLTQLLGVTQIQFVDYFFDFDKDYSDFYPITIGHFYGALYYSNFKMNDFYTFTESLKEAEERISNYSRLYETEHLYNDIRSTHSKYLLTMNSENLYQIQKNLDEIETLFNQSSMMFFSLRPHFDYRLFFFDITYDDDNKITISKNYFNKEYITTTRIRGYYDIF